MLLSRKSIAFEETIILSISNSLSQRNCIHQTAVAVHKKGSVNAHFENVYVWDKHYIYLYTLVFMTKFVLKFNGIKFVFAVTSQLPFSAYLSKGI